MSDKDQADSCCDGRCVKTGEIKRGVTPPETTDGDKQAGDSTLDHLTQRAADAAKAAIRKNG